MRSHFIYEYIRIQCVWDVIMWIRSGLIFAMYTYIVQDRGGVCVKRSQGNAFGSKSILQLNNII